MRTAAPLNLVLEMDFNDVCDILGSLEIVEKIHQLTALFANDEINNHYYSR